jgi:uracil-DNA glycosylase
MPKGLTQSLDENIRRYYLDAMGIQCWELIDSPQKSEDALTLESSNRDVAAVSYAHIEETIQQCTQCPLHKTRKQALPGRGNQSAELMFVVLSPAADEDEDGVICSGEANVLFSKMLAAINIDINDVYLTSLLKCKVPVNHTVSPKEIQCCNTYLDQQIQFIQPKLLVVLGETATHCLLQKNLSIDDGRAMNVDMSYQVASIPLFVSYSPEELLQQPENKRKAWSDLQQLQKILDNKM